MMRALMRHLGYALYAAAAPARQKRPPLALILTYHRVCTAAHDPWSLNVSLANFAAQMRVLHDGFHVLPLSDLVHAYQEQQLPPRAVAITFDDGYANNLYAAQHLLEQYALPAALFVVSGYIGQVREFWWDELDRHILEAEAVPPTLSLEVRGRRFIWDVDRSGDGQARLGLYYDLVRKLDPLPHATRLPLLDEIAAWSGSDTLARQSHRAMTQEELRQFAQSPRIEIGAHTVTHPRLSTHSARVQWQEISESQKQLAGLLNRPVTSFSFPHGAYAWPTLEVLHKESFAYACTTEAEPLREGVDPLRLPRFTAGNWDQAEFARRLHQWFA